MTSVLCKDCNEKKEPDEISIFLYRVNKKDIPESGNVILAPAQEGLCIDCMNLARTRH